MMEPTILIVSPVRNEAAHIERVAAAVAAQEKPPDRWLIVDDGSTDGTRERLRALEAELPFMSVIDAPRNARVDAARDRLAAAAEIRNFNFALAGVELANYTHVMKLDGDIELPRAYLRVSCERFAADGRLGITGGVLVEPAAEGGVRRITIPAHHVHGAVKLYSFACLEAIGGVPERLGWDTIDETYARMRGFLTVTFADLVCVHHRPIASADGKLRGRARHGQCAYVAHYPPVWVGLRALKVARSRPFGFSGAAFVFGYARAGLSGVEQVPDPEFRRFTRRELRARMARPLVDAVRRPLDDQRANHEPKELHSMPIQHAKAGETSCG